MIVVQTGLGKRKTPISKITRVKRIGGMDQVVESLTSLKP
jgi:hypothetical protein